MGSFNSREIATAFWLLVFAAWALRKPEIRNSVAGVLRAFWHFKIVLSVSLMLCYVVVVVAFLAAVGIWKFELLKDTMVWFFAGAMSLMIRSATADDKDNILRKILTDSIKIVILLEFLVNTYTFPLLVELIVVPLLTFIVMVDAVASMKEEHAIVARLAKAIEMVAGFVILGIVVTRAVADFQNLKSLDTFRSIALAPLLSVLMSPFIYMMLVILKYELVFMRLDFGGEKTRSLKRYARCQIMMHAGLNLKRLQLLLRNHMVDLMHIEKKSDVDRFLGQARSAHAQEGKR